MDISFVSTVSGIPQTLKKDKMIGDMVETKGIVPAENVKKIPSKENTRQELEISIGDLNKFMQSSNTHLSFVLHDRLHEYYVQVVNDQTQEVVREVPSRRVLDMVAEMKSKLGFLIDEKR